jgi:anti-sigma factor RsiW
MSEDHLRENELAHLGGGEAEADAAEHLRWCTRCRSTVADYRWLQQQLASALAAVDALPVPRPQWWAIQERLSAIRRQQVAGRRISTAGVAATVCLMLLFSSLLGTTVVAQAVFPEAVVTPAPVTAIVSGEPSAPAATPAPAILDEGSGLSLTPAFVPLPTPPQPEA